MREFWPRFRDAIDAFYERAGPSLRDGRTLEQPEFDDAAGPLGAALEASAEIRIQAEEALADAHGAEFEAVSRLVLAGAAVDAMLASDIAAVDPELAVVPREDGAGLEEVDDERRETLAEADRLFERGREGMMGAQSAPAIRDALIRDVDLVADQLVGLAAGSGSALAGGLLSVAVGEVAQFATNVAHVDVLTELGEAQAAVASHAPRFLREHLLKISAVRVGDWLQDKVGDLLSKALDARALLAGELEAGDVGR